jgi:DNA-binding PadR family transcriptional regulator
MRHRFGPRGFIEINLPDGLLAMARGGRGGWSANWGGDWAGDGGQRLGRRRRRMFDPGELRLVLLKLIGDQPRHGYDLIRAIEELTGGAYAPSPGVVYPTLTMLQDMGLITEQESEGPRKAYQTTAEGRAHLEERTEEVEELLERLSGHGDGPRKAGGAPIKRAVGNLMAAVWHRVTAEDSGEETLHDIADILDEAARKIERLKRRAPEA